MPRVQRIDHVTFAIEKGMIERWAWFHIEREGGRLINKIDDVDPTNPDSSMRIWCLDYGGFGVALVEGIDFDLAYAQGDDIGFAATEFERGRPVDRRRAARRHPRCGCARRHHDRACPGGPADLRMALEEGAAP